MSTKKSITKKARSAYAAAGVDIDQKMAGIASIKKMVKSTRTPGVLNDIGSFGGFFASPGKDKILVASTDGVGTKLKIAALAGKHDTVGQDIVNHCVNDILVQGAVPLFFMDYVGISKFEGWIFEQVVSGLCKACRENGCALLGGETAEMPGLYPPKEYDLVGTIVGVVDRRDVVTGKAIRPGDVLIGLPSSGLHTNGYSLARRVVFEQARLKIADIFPGTNKTVAEVLLAVHKSYLKPVTTLMKAVKIRGMAHITGGGFIDNVPRVLPDEVNAVFDRAAWIVPEVYKFIQKVGNVDREEMFRVFNMGIGMVVVVRKQDVERSIAVLRKSGEKPVLIGWVEKGSRTVRLIN
ncbi:MAG: phosphoribosylformylglycinamidine cyclo-ligase [bacterium]